MPRSNKQISYLFFKFFTHLHTFHLRKRYAMEVLSCAHCGAKGLTPAVKENSHSSWL
jgi:hypothetical protein